jgi:uncharacterized membrane protein
MTATRKNQLILLATMAVFCLILCGIRIAFTGSLNYFFLNWNLFLAFLPLLFTTLLLISGDFAQKRWVKFSVLGSWLLFFPNAPYILTDIFHLRGGSDAPMWFDLILILTYAWTGLIAGFISLFDIEQIVFKDTPRTTKIILSIGLIFVTAFGIYLGRYLRFNSWDLFNHPGALFSEITDRFINPFRHTRTWGVTLGLGVLLNFMYWSLRTLFSGQQKNFGLIKSTNE